MRKRELNLVVGQKGTGKTHFLKEIALERLRKGDNVLVVVPFANLWDEFATISTAREVAAMRNQAARLVYDYSNPKSVEAIRYFRKGVLILEDARSYFTAATPQLLQYIYSLNRHLGLDVYFVAHGFKYLPPQSFGYAQWLILFNCGDKPDTRKEILDDNLIKQIQYAQTAIKQELKTGNPYAKRIIQIDEQISATYYAGRQAGSPSTHAERISQ